MLRPSPNHGTQRLPNDDDDDLSDQSGCTTLRLVVGLPPIFFSCMETKQCGEVSDSGQPSLRLSDASLNRAISRRMSRFSPDVTVDHIIDRRAQQSSHDYLRLIVPSIISNRW